MALHTTNFYLDINTTLISSVQLNAEIATDTIERLIAIFDFYSIGHLVD